MPFFLDNPAEAGPRLPMAQEPGVGLDPSISETVGAAFRQSNVLVSGANYFADHAGQQLDLSHNPLDVISGTKYFDDNLDSFVDSRNENETRAIMRRIDQEEQDKRILGASGATGIVADIAASVLDPTIFVPGVAFVKTGRAGWTAARSAMAVGASTGAMTAAQEASLYATQETRTPEEFAVNVGTATLLGGLLGAGAGALLGRGERVALEGKLNADRADMAIELEPELPRAPEGVHPSATTAESLRLRKGFTEKLDDVFDAVARPGGTGRVFTDLGAIADPERLARETGLTQDFSRFRHTIENDALKHAFRQHGDPLKEAPRGQIAITRADFDLLPEVLANPDLITHTGKNDLGRDLIQYRKVVGEEIFYVQEVRAGRYELAMHTMWKRKGTGAVPPAAAPASGSGALDETLLPKPQALTSEAVSRDAEGNIADAGGSLNGSAGPGSAGAAASDARALELQGSGKVANVLNKTPVLNRITGSPLTRTFLSPFTSARRSMADLAETPLRFEQNRQGIPTTQGPATDRLARMATQQAQVRMNEELDRLFVELRTGEMNAGFVKSQTEKLRATVERARGGDQARMTNMEFREAIGRAMRDGDTSDIPQVAQAAKFVRETVFDPWKERAIKAGLLPEDIDPKTALSYFSRVYNREKINARRPEFQRRISTWLGKEQADKAAAKERLTDLNAKLKEVGKQRAKIEAKLERLDAREDDLAARSSERGMEAERAGKRADTVEERATTIAEDVTDLEEFVAAMRAEVRNPALRARIDALADDAADLRRAMAEGQRGLDAKRGKLRTAEARADEAVVAADANAKRLDVLERRADLAEERRGILQAAVTMAREEHADIRAKIEAEVEAWAGRSTVEAKSSLAARTAYDEMRANKGTGNGERLTSADKAVDRAVRRILRSDRDLSPDELHSRAGEIIDRIVSGPDGRLAYDAPSGGPKVGAPSDGPPPRGALAARQFMIPDKEIEDFLESDVEHVANQYLRSVVPDVLLTERFGDADMTEAFRALRDEHDQLANAAKSEKERVKLRKEYETAVTDLAAVRDRIRNVYGFDPKMRNFARVASAAKVYNGITDLGGATLNSLSDMSGAIFLHGFTKVLGDGYRPFVKGLLGASDGYAKAKLQYRAMGIAIETRLNARANDAYDLVDMYRPESRIERGLGQASNAMQVANLQAPWTDFGKTIASVVSGNEIFRAAKAVTSGTATAKQLTNLAASNIDAAMARRIWKQFETGGEVVDGVHLPNTGDWADIQAREAFEGAVAREADIAIITPGQEKPLWLSSPIMSVLGQFKTFTAAATERVLIANLQRREAQTLSGLFAGVTAGIISYRLYTLATGQEMSDDPRDWMREGISRSGALGWFEEGNTLLAKATRGQADIYRLTGSDKPLTKYASRNFVGQLLGPTAGKIENLVTATGSAATADWTASDTHRVRRLLPFQNLFYLRAGLDKVEEATNGLMGVAAPAR
jgi:hypothetical protein